MKKLFAFGVNEFGQVNPLGPKSFIALPEDITEQVEACNLIFASWSQAVGVSPQGTVRVWGNEAKDLQYSFPFRSNVLLGRDAVEGCIEKGSVHTASGSRLDVDATMAACDARGRLLVKRSDGSLVLYDSLQKATDGNVLAQLPEASSIKAGAAHFLVSCTSTRTVYGLGDNRFGQAGLRAGPEPLGVPRSIELLEGIDVVDLAAGDLHSAAIDASGGLYVWGSDAKGQCGGFCSTSGPELVEFPGDEQPDALLVACGSTHTVVATSDGVYACGNNDFGQLGLGDRMSRTLFVRIPTMDGIKIERLMCSRLATYFVAEVDG